MKIFWIPLWLISIVCSSLMAQENRMIMTVKGPILPEQMGSTLIHEHLLVDFIGADQYDPTSWDKDEVADVVLPFLEQVKALGANTLIECTPAYLGRDIPLLVALSQRSGLNLITNTGYYGAVDNKFMPEHAFTETAEELASRWIAEWEQGIEGTGIKPGFIKIGVNSGNLSPLHQKLVKAAALTHVTTGLTIASHTGPSLAAFQQLELLENEGVAPNAFIWVHAQAEKDKSKHVAAAEKGAWISLDGIGEQNLEEYLDFLLHLKSKKLLHRVLISHDAGWYSPREVKGGEFRPFSIIGEKFIPLLLSNGFTQDECHRLLVENPANAFSIQKKLHK
ncbi:phosphotriesterase family protein [Lunatibacter salilacus]|uniref:phosphotriesterase family protein n=1 Tax=Lunatibacter salilacus TaxID=2483804 RepID=UPI00131CE0AD|nr:phosphotriesterase [Lunatibacter salilacus]